jgi:hypothetical protein
MSGVRGGFMGIGFCEFVFSSVVGVITTLRTRLLMIACLDRFAVFEQKPVDEQVNNES